MAKQLTQTPKFQAFDLNGDPLVSGKVYTYVTGSSTPATTYTDATGNSSNQNPVILDSRGEADIWLTPGTIYRFILKDSNDVQIWSVDSIGVNDLTVNNLTVTGTTTLSGDITGDEAWLAFAAADQAALITTGTNKFVAYGMPACTVLEVRAGIVTASSSGVVTFDINDANTTMLSTKLTIDANENSSVTAATPPVISVAAHSNNWTLQIDYDTVGTGAKGPIVYMRVKWA